MNDAGDPKYKKLFREMDDLRKLLLVYRIIHYDDQIPDIQLSIKNRDKQLCKPVLRLFKNTKALKEIIAALSKFLAEKNDKKLNSLDSYLYSIISDLVKNDNTIISNELLWGIICSLPGSSIPYKPQSYQTDEFGSVSKTRVTRICEDKFGATNRHDGERRSLVFNKAILQKLKGNYSSVKEIEILDGNDLTNTSNTFNTFWKCIEGNGIHDTALKGNELTNYGQKTTEDEGNSEFIDESNNNSMMDIKENEGAHPAKVLEVLEVLENEKQIADKIKEKQLYKKWPDSDTWSCPNCNVTGDKWHMLEHVCKKDKKC